jgi:peptidoglycan/LPS O-acetylase OafA/YrhL
MAAVNNLSANNLLATAEDSVVASPPGEIARVAALDTLRGLAALSVVICHYLILLSETRFDQIVIPWLAIPPLSLMLTAQSAVILFFVLSGYVLALSLMGEHRPTWLGFILRRLCRIWLPFAAVLLVSFCIGCVAVTANTVLPPHWQMNIWRPETMTFASLLHQLTMASTEIDLDLPAWTLVLELRISLIFPLLFVLVRRAPGMMLTASLGLFIVGRVGPTWLTQLVPDTATYIVYFVGGAWLALNRRRIIDRIGAASGLARATLGLIALLLLSTRAATPVPAIGAGLGAMLLIGFAVAPASRWLLSAPWCLFLGRISYSLYLTHVVVLMTLGSLLGSHLSMLPLLIVAMPIIGLVAWASYRWCELPSVRLGRLLSARCAVLSRRSGSLLVAPHKWKLGGC